MLADMRAGMLTQGSFDYEIQLACDVIRREMWKWAAFQGKPVIKQVLFLADGSREWHVSFIFPSGKYGRDGLIVRIGGECVIQHRAQELAS